MSEVTLKFANQEQYQEFINKVKNDVLEEVNKNSTYDIGDWEKFKRRFLEERRLEAISGKWDYTADRNEFYGMFKMAFNARTVWHLNNVDVEKLESFKEELMDLINKYREETIKG